MLNEKINTRLSLTDTQEIITQPVAVKHIRQWNANQLSNNVPMEELRVLRAVVKLQNATADLNKLWYWHWLFRTQTWKAAKKLVDERLSAINMLIDKGDKYLASYNKVMGIDTAKLNKQ